jgi:hypothetical protein
MMILQVVLNLNSNLWGGSGALIVGNYKLIVNPNPKEAKIYAHVRQQLAQAPEVKHVDLTDTVKGVVSDLLSTAEIYLFKLDENPSEDDSGECESLAACHNLWSKSAFSHVQMRMVERMEELRAQMVPSTFRWEDDGPWADPRNFGGVWSSWRDEAGTLVSNTRLMPVINTQTVRYDCCPFFCRDGLRAVLRLFREQRGHWRSADLYELSNASADTWRTIEYGAAGLYGRGVHACIPHGTSSLRKGSQSRVSRIVGLMAQAWQSHGIDASFFRLHVNFLSLACSTYKATSYQQVNLHQLYAPDLTFPEFRAQPRCEKYVQCVIMCLFVEYICDIHPHWGHAVLTLITMPRPLSCAH